MAIRPITVAIAAAALLLVTLATDVAVTRTATLEVEDRGTWKVVAADPAPDGRLGPYGYRSVAPLQVDGNGTVEFRLTLDNEYPWAWSEEYVLYANGREVARGMLDAPARGEANVRTGVPVKDLLGGPGGPVEAPKSDTQYSYPSIELTLGGRQLYANLALEVSL